MAVLLAGEQGRDGKPEQAGAFGRACHIVRAAFPCSRVVAVEPLADGLRNTNLKLRLDAPPACFVLRIYEHHPSLCQKELDLMRLVGGAVPVPEVVHFEPRGFEDLPPFALLRYVEGITLRELRRSGEADAIAEAARCAGEALAAIGRATFAKPGWLAPGPIVTTPLLEGADPVPRFVELCLASPSLETRMPADLRSRTQAFVWSRAPQFARLADDARHMHGDFNGRNLVVRQASARWTVTAVLDWEFAVSASFE